MNSPNKQTAKSYSLRFFESCWAGVGGAKRIWITGLSIWRKCSILLSYQAKQDCLSLAVRFDKVSFLAQDLCTVSEPLLSQANRSGMRRNQKKPHKLTGILMIMFCRVKRYWRRGRRTSSPKKKKVGLELSWIYLTVFLIYDILSNMISRCLRWMQFALPRFTREQLLSWRIHSFNMNQCLYRNKSAGVAVALGWSIGTIGICEFRFAF